jgi:predicted nucleic acid-binding protein
VLLDTCVLSELRRPKCNPAVRQAVEVLDSGDLFLSVVSIGEIAKGIVLLRERKQKHELRIWLQSLERLYADRILDIDIETSHMWGELTAAMQQKGRVLPAADGLIAATARRHGLHVMTRNAEHFAPAGVLVLNPWE